MSDSVDMGDHLSLDLRALIDDNNKPLFLVPFWVHVDYVEPMLGEE